MEEFFNSLFKKGEKKIKKGSIVKDNSSGNYYVVALVLDDYAFIEDGYNWSGVEHILKWCPKIKLSELTLVK